GQLRSPPLEFIRPTFPARMRPHDSRAEPKWHLHLILKRAFPCQRNPSGPGLFAPRTRDIFTGFASPGSAHWPRDEGSVFDQLSDKLDSVLSGFRQRGLLTEPMIRDGLREIRRVLLEADVNYQVTREFLKRVEGKALGERVLKSV